MDNSKSLHRQVAKWWTFERFLLCVLSIALLLSLSQIRTTQTTTHEVRSTSSEGFLRTTATAGLKLQCTVVSAEDAPKSESDIIIHQAPPRSNAAVITPPLVHRAPIVAPPAAPLFPPPPPLLPLPPSPPKSVIEKATSVCVRDAYSASRNILVNPNSPVPPPYSPPSTLQGASVRVIEPAARNCACSTWAYDRIHNKESSILSGDNLQPFQGGVKDINEFLPRIRKELLGASHITELGVREAISSWTFAAVAAEAADLGRPISYRALDITKRDGVECMHSFRLYTK
jgi:hypothetical protein